MEVRELEGTAPPRAARTEPLLLEMPAQQCTDGLVVRLKEVLAGHPGSVPVMLRLTSNGSGTTLRLGEGYRVDGSGGLLAELRTLLGPESVATG